MTRKLFIIFLSLLFSSCAEPADREIPSKTELLFYGVFDNSDVYQKIIKDYEDDHPDVSVTYRKLAYEEYFDRLNGLLANGQPDIFMLPYHQVGVFRESISPLKNVLISELKNDFVPAAAEVCADEDVICLPASFDNLVLFYNPNLVSDPASTWEGIMEQAQKIYLDSGGKIGGIAIGNFENITRAEEILLLLLLQRGVDIQRDLMGNDFTGTGYLVVDEIRDLWRGNKTWDSGRPYYATAMAEGKLGMMVAYSFMKDRILQDNPDFEIALAPIPYFDGQEGSGFSLASGWVYAVNSGSRGKDQAEDFIIFATLANNARHYAEKADLLPARRDLLSKIKKNSPYYIWAKQSERAMGLPSAAKIDEVIAILREWVKS